MAAIVPAQLSFLAIYNPDLGQTDETFRDQVVYWFSRSARERKKDGAKLQEEENEKLRQIGLAQGMVDFAKSFANGQPVDSIETEKSRIILHELEANWWILASIDLTKLPSSAQSTTKDAGSEQAKADAGFEYSSREVSPAPLLLRQIMDGHRMFLLHNGASLTKLFYKLSRQKFCGLLERFWNRFTLNWDVLLHGNPAIEVYGGLKLAAGGELGFGVGEEAWGSGEREVLEDFARRTDGLVDLMVSRFGEASQPQNDAGKQGLFGKRATPKKKELDVWMGAGNHAQAGDGVVFSGIGALSRASLRDVSRWTQDIYAYGDSTYGVGIHPSNDRRKRRRRQAPTADSADAKSYADSPRIRKAANSKVSSPPGIPPPIVSAVERSLERATSSHDIKKAKPTKEIEKSDNDESAGWTKYLTLGYGSTWGNTGSNQTFARQDSAPLSEGGEHDREPVMRQIEPEPDADPEIQLEERLKTQVRMEENGHFMIGLKGELTDESLLETDDEVDEDWNERTMLRTLHVTVLNPNASVAPSPLETPTLERDSPRLSRLRVIVYAHRPFIYTFLFHPRTESVSLPAFYKNLHTFFAPLHKPLSTSTSPARVAQRIATAAAAPVPPSTAPVKPDETRQPIFDLVFDPRNISLHASIPNIPQPGSLAADGLSLAPGGSVLPEGWTRAEALNVHSAILEVVRSTRPSPGLIGEGGERELERSIKTGRGWWVVWMRLDDEAHLKKQEKAEDTSQAASQTGSLPPDDEATPISKAHPAVPGKATDYFDEVASSAAGHQEDAPATAEDPDISILADSREAILVRRAHDALPNAGKNKSFGSSGIWSLGMGGGGGSSGDRSGKDAASGWGPARLAEGVGVDARKYVEGLLSLNR